MDVRGRLHERHHNTTLQPDVLIVESGPNLDLRTPADDSESSVLVPLVPELSAPDPEAIDLEARGRDVDEGASPSSSPEPALAWDETYRFRKRFGRLPLMDTLDVMRESARVLRRQSDLLTSLTAAFIVPVSVVILTHVLVTRRVVHWLETRLEVSMLEESVAAAIRTRYTNFFYLKLAEVVVTWVLCIPLNVSLAALSKAGIVYAVASTYAGVKVSFMEVLHLVVPRVWLPLTITYASSCAIFLGTGVVALLCIVTSNGVFAALHASSAIILFLFVMLGLVFWGIFVYLKIVWNVASVICILEDKLGFTALARSFSILRGRVQVAVGCYLVTFLCGAFLTLLFEFRVTDRNAYTEYNASGAWEGPLLILMHSFVYMFDDIMTTVFFFTCPRSSSSSFEAYDATAAAVRVVPEGVGSIALTLL